jgi:hypothetical protein
MSHTPAPPRAKFRKGGSTSVLCFENAKEKRFSVDSRSGALIETQR